MRPRIAIPMPHASDREYAERAIPQYERAVELAGGQPVRIDLNQTPAAVGKAIADCGAVLLPGSKADIDPARFRAKRSPHAAPADPRREAVDRLLLGDAYKLQKPVLGICYGLQSLNVYRGGSLIQHIPEFLAQDRQAKVNHEAGKQVAVAHMVEIEDGSRLALIVSGEDRKGRGLPRADESAAKNRALAPAANPIVLPVNSSHHQSAHAIGQGLHIVARCPDDGIIEAVEGIFPDHFLLAVQ